MNVKFEEWSLEDVLSLLFGEEAKYIVQVIRGKDLDGIPESVFINKTIKDNIVDGYTHLAQNYYGGTFGDKFTPSSALGVCLNPLIITCWLRDKGIFDSLFFYESPPEGAEEKITALKESINKEFDSIDFKEFSRSDYWSKTEFYVLLFGKSYSDIFFPHLFRQFPPNLDQEIFKVERFLDAAIEKKILVAIQSAIPRLLSEDYFFNDYFDKFEPTQLLAILDSKGYPVPADLLKSIEEGKFDDAEGLLKELHESMLYLLEHGKNPHQPPKKAQPHSSTVRGKTLLIKNGIEVIAVRLLRENPETPLMELAGHEEIRTVIESIDPNSVLADETVVTWLREAAKKNGIKRKSGRPRKK
jgi:hypothetical protein